MRLISIIVFLALMTVPGLSQSIKILAFGDSLTSGFGLEPEEAFPARLEAALRARGHDVLVINGGVAGDTAKDGLSRLEWSLDSDVDAVIVEFGANDALRGLPPKQAEEALDALMAKFARRGLPVLIAGMRAPPNLGEAYAAAFNGIYGRLADRYGALLYPFFLEGVAANVSLNQADGMHPNARGVATIVNNILPFAEQLIGKAKRK